MAHTHRVKTSTTVGFFCCVNPHNCNPAAHGNVNHIDTCGCGATRETLVNGNHIERGRWIAKDEEE